MTAKQPTKDASIGAGEIPWIVSLDDMTMNHVELACAETRTVLAMHIGSGTKVVSTSDDAPARS